MEKLEKTIKYVNLYNIYKSQLSNSQREMLGDYFFLDLSISEIAENRNISRSAVEDALSKGINKLDELEKNLQILATNKKVLEKGELALREGTWPASTAAPDVASLWGEAVLGFCVLLGVRTRGAEALHLGSHSTGAGGHRHPASLAGSMFIAWSSLLGARTLAPGAPQLAGQWTQTPAAT